MRIAFLESTSEMGGGEHVLLALVGRFARTEVQPLLIASQEGELVTRTAKANIPTLVLPLPTFPSLSFVMRNHKIVNPLAVIDDFALVVLAALRTARVLRSERIELVHTNTLFAHLYGGLAARLAGVPCVWHIHDVIDAARFGGLSGWLWRMLGRVLPTHIVGSSNAAVQIFSNPAKCSTIYAGIDRAPSVASTWEGWRAKLGLDGDTVLVGYVRRIGWFKGLDILADAAKQIVAQNRAVHFVILGAPFFGEDDYAEQVERQVREGALIAHWHTVGYIPDAANYLDDLDVLVLPSRRESFPRLLLEAGLAGRAVVATAVGGVPEIIESGITGVLVPFYASASETAEAVATAILALADDAPLRQMLGAGLRERVLNEYSLEHSASRFIELYRSILHVTAPLVRPQSPQHLCAD